MAEIVSNVYDIKFPSPPALKEIIPISIALQLWRQEIESHRNENSLMKIYTKRETILSNFHMPDMPSAHLSVIEEHVILVGIAVKKWLKHHCVDEKIFKIEILNDFNDFAVDFDGSIHFVRTAKRIVECERVDPVSRFNTACAYCFVEDISRIWPLVTFDESLKFKRHLQYYPVLRYWIYQMKNQSYKSPSSNEQIFNSFFFPRRYGLSCRACSRASLVEYFWNRLNIASRMRILSNPPARFYEIYRYLLTKFNEAELDEFVNKSGNDLIFSLLRESNREPYVNVMQPWNYIKDRISEDGFFLLVQKIIKKLCRSHSPVDTSSCREIWYTAPNHLKPRTIRGILEENSLFQTDENSKKLYTDGLFLFVVFLDASVNDQRTFWDKHWRSLIVGMRIEDLDRLMRLCYRDENDIVKFKLESMSEYENIRGNCSRLLNNLCLEELDNFLRFCCPDEQMRRNTRLQLLKDFRLDFNNITKITPLMNDFIDEVYGDVNLAADYKAQLLSSESTLATFSLVIGSFAYDHSFHHVIKCIDTLAPSQKVALDLKKLHIFPMFENIIRAGFFLPRFEEGEFSNFMRECLSSEGEISQFKETLNVDEIVQNEIRCSMNKFESRIYHCFLVQFLEWYFITPQALKEFKTKYSHDDVFVRLTTK